MLDPESLLIHFETQQLIYKIGGCRHIPTLRLSAKGTLQHHHYMREREAIPTRTRAAAFCHNPELTILLFQMI